MIKTASSVLLFLLIFTLSLDAKSLLYKVSSAGSSIYILGSIHLAKPELYPLDSAINEAYSKSDVLVVELDAESRAAMTVMQDAMRTLGVYPKGRTLQSELSVTTYRELERYTQQRGIPLESLEHMRPWVVMLQLSMAEMLRMGYDPELGIDKHFLDRAKKEKKAVVALETIEEQMALLSRDDRAYQEKLLRYTLASMGEMEPMLNVLFTSWKNGDAEAIEKLFLLAMQDDAGLEDVYDDLVTRRNYKMAEKIEAFLGTGRDYFVVVGAGHVVGREGIIDLLKKRGYKVMQK